MMKKKLNLLAPRSSEPREDANTGTRTRARTRARAILLKSLSSPSKQTRASRSHSPPNSFQEPNKRHRRLLSSPQQDSLVGSVSPQKLSIISLRRSKSTNSGAGGGSARRYSTTNSEVSTTNTEKNDNHNSLENYSSSVPVLNNKYPYVNTSMNYRNNDKRLMQILSDSSSDDEISTGTQESEYDNTSNRVTCYVYKRKSGFSGKLKKKYVVASERGKHVSKHVSHQLEFWKTGISKIGGGHAQGNSNNENTPDEANSKQDASGINVKMWERRRLVLEGRLLMYYHEDAGLEDEDTDDIATTPMAMTPSNTAQHPHTLQRLKQKLNELAEHANPLKHSSQPDINVPRGFIDIIDCQTTASIVPISPHSFAPTPYCLAIMVKSESKWVLCFDSEREVLKWLTIFTNVSLRRSVERFKKDHGKDFESTPLPLGDETEFGGKRSTANPRNLAKEAATEARQPSVNSPVEMHSGGNLFSAIEPGPHAAVGENIGARNKRSFLSNSCTEMLTDSDNCKVFALVNSAFLLMALEKAAILVHPLAFVVVNVLAWMHLKGASRSSQVQTTEEEPQSSEQERVDDSQKSISIRRNQSTLSDLSIEEAGAISPIRRQVTISNSFVEMRKSMDDADSIYRPQAGATTTQLKSIYEKNESGECKFAWVSAKPSIIDLRGPDYLTSKRKIPSPTSLYELVQLDAFDSKEHMTDVGQRFRFPDYDYGDVGHWCAPDTLIISFALPTSPPKLRSASNGKGYIVCGYFRIRSEVRKTLEIISNPDYNDNEREAMLHALFPDNSQRMLVNGVKLWEKWCASAKTDPEMQKRLKFIPRGDNLKDLGVPSWICRYNGKPMLIKRPGETSFIFSRPGDRILEIDVNLHPLPFLFKQAMAYLKNNYFPRMIMTFAFIIEGREEDELPEVLLGNPIQLPFCNPNSIMQADDVFSCDQASF